jgi:hypothetical protein
MCARENLRTKRLLDLPRMGGTGPRYENIWHTGHGGHTGKIAREICVFSRVPQSATWHCGRMQKKITWHTRHTTTKRLEFTAIFIDYVVCQLAQHGTPQRGTARRKRWHIARKAYDPGPNGRESNAEAEPPTRACPGGACERERK